MARHGLALTLASLPDDALQEIIAAFVEADSIDYLPRIDLPDFEDVKGLGCTSKGMRQQLVTALAGRGLPVTAAGRDAAKLEAVVCHLHRNFGHCQVDKGALLNFLVCCSMTIAKKQIV